MTNIPIIEENHLIQERRQKLSNIRAKTIAFPTLLVISCVLVLLTWKFHMYYETWYGSDYDARMEFKNRGYNDEQITYAIEQLYKIGILYKHEEPD